MCGGPTFTQGQHHDSDADGFLLWGGRLLDIEAAKAQVDDCYFRMIEPSEAAAAMAFPSTYEWSGNRRERTRLAGNAVTPPAARDIVGAVAAALA